MSTKRRYDSSDDVATQRRVTQEVEPPKRYKVLLHNDDYSTMEFVVSILRTIFGKNEQLAAELMLQVHNNGLCIAGIYPFEIAETKVAQTIAAAQAQEFPFLATLEPEGNPSP